MANTRPTKLDPAVDLSRDHVLGPPDAEVTLVEYGSYACRNCHAGHEVVEGLRSRFGDRMRYVFRHLPVSGSEDAVRAAELAEYAAESVGRFWEVHEALMERGPAFAAGDFGRIARQFNLPPSDAANEPTFAAAQARVCEDVESARRSGLRVTPTFFINGRRYAGTWDESSLADAMLGSLGHRIQSAAFEFVRWGPSSGLLLGLATVVALVLSNSPLRFAFQSWWDTRVGFQWGVSPFALTLLDWVNHGLLTIFFIVVGLEIKREFTVGHLASFRSGALPVIAAMGGIAQRQPEGRVPEGFECRAELRIGEQHREQRGQQQHHAGRRRPAREPQRGHARAMAQRSQHGIRERGLVPRAVITFSIDEKRRRVAHAAGMRTRDVGVDAAAGLAFDDPGFGLGTLREGQVNRH